MAIANTATISETYCLRDIKRAWANAFCTSGNDFYFAYVNWTNHAVVHTSTDNGLTWRKVWDFGIRDGITVTTSPTGDIIATYWDSQIRVARNGAEISLGSIGGVFTDSTIGFAVCFYPLLIVGGPATVTVRIDHFPSWGTDISTSMKYGLDGGGVNAVLGYSADGSALCCIVTQAHYQSSTYLGAYFVPINTNLPAVSVATGSAANGPTDPTDTWPGVSESNSYAYCGWRSLPDFEGVGTGDYGFWTNGPGYLGTAGCYSPGLNRSGTRLGPALRADRGMTGPHAASFCARVDGQLVFAFVDLAGLIGSTVASTDPDITDSNNVPAAYSRARAYGTLPGLTTPLMWGQAYQSGGRLTFFVLTSESDGVPMYLQHAETGTTMNLVRISDTAVHQKRRNSNIMLCSAVAVSTPITTKTTTGNALGVIRQHAKGTAFNLTTLLDALTDSGRSVLPNPNKSHGCSPVLRALLTQAGLAFSVTRELFNDADPRSHKGGNALDVAAPSPDGMATICAFLACVPTLFATVVYTTPTQSLYIWDGKIASVKQFGGATAQIVADSAQAIHISSSTTRLIKALHSSPVRVTLGIAPPITDAGTPTGRKALDPFTADQYVYVGNAINVDDDDIAPSAHLDTDHGSDFW